MPADVDLANDALAQIGATPITALDDSDVSINAQYCKAMYPMLRDAVLRDHLWNFAKKRATLTPTATPPLFQWPYSYQLPPDCLRVLRMGVDDNQSWKIEGKLLLTNVSYVNSPMTILYIAQITDLSQWDAMAYQALATRLASKLAGPIQHDLKLAEQKLAEYKALFVDAAAVNGQEGIQDRMDVPDLTYDVRDDNRT